MAESIRKELEYRQWIIEIAPGDVILDCEFIDCEFVGLGPALFKRCRFRGCDMSRISNRKHLEFEKCTPKQPG